MLFKVKGSPTTWGGGKKERRWREAIYEKAKEYQKEFDKLIRNKTSEKHFKITITFFLNNPEGKGNSGQDVDNLAKPVLDTLFNEKRIKLKNFSGALSKSIDDKEIYVLHIIKKKREQEGAEIEIQLSTND